MAKIGEVREISLEDLKPYARNAKVHSDRQVEQIAASIKEFGFISPILIDKEMNIIAGHGRCMAARSLGMAAVPAVFVEGLTEEQRRAYILADNRLTELGEWNRVLISEELEALQGDGFDIDLTGFSIDDIIIDESQAPEVMESEVEALLESSKTPRIKPGEVWELGEHRLMCGDSTKAEDVRKLMNGALADLLLTDPPYNVALGVGDTPEVAKKRHRRTDGLKLQNDAMEAGNFEEFLHAAFQNATEAMKEGAAYYCWYASTSQKSFQTALEKAGLPPHQILIWIKNAMVLGRQDYQWRHEPCFYGWKEGAAHYFIDIRSFTTVEDNIDTISREEAIRRLKDLAQFSTAVYEDKPTTSELHPTMKPLALFKKQIRNSTKPGDLVLDLFAGSGTAIIAAEEMDRRCYSMEFDPHYAEVIIQRWEEATGRKAKIAKEAKRGER